MWCIVDTPCPKKIIIPAATVTPKPFLEQNILYASHKYNPSCPKWNNGHTWVVDSHWIQSHSCTAVPQVEVHVGVLPWTHYLVKSYDDPTLLAVPCWCHSK